MWQGSHGACLLQPEVSWHHAAVSVSAACEQQSYSRRACSIYALVYVACV